MNEPIAPCQFLDWDTEFFGHRIARLNGTRLEPEFLQSALDWCQAQDYRMPVFPGRIGRPANRLAGAGASFQPGGDPLHAGTLA